MKINNMGLIAKYTKLQGGCGGKKKLLESNQQ